MFRMGHLGAEILLPLQGQGPTHACLSRSLSLGPDHSQMVGISSLLPQLEGLDRKGQLTGVALPINCRIKKT